MFASSMIRVFPSLEHSAGHVRIPETICRTFVCVPYWHLWTKHNRAKPMSESASALFSIADAGEFRFARFYIVCEEVPLGTPESPLIVCGLSDTLRECPNVAKTRNGMPATAWKKYVNFASKNFPPSVYSGTFLFSGLLIILLIIPKRPMLIATISFAIFCRRRVSFGCMLW